MTTIGALPYVIEMTIQSYDRTWDRNTRSHMTKQSYDHTISLLRDVSHIMCLFMRPWRRVTYFVNW